MKRISIIVTALAFLVALTQCKKEAQVVPANEGNSVNITLDIKKDGGSKVNVNTVTGAVTYESGDKIYVASGGRYVGMLTHNGTRFSGTITDPVVGEPLDFYFLGNVTPAETLAAGTTTTCSVVISDQTQRLPVIEYAPSNENYTAGASSFTAHLLNKCALVKFNVTTSSEAATCITGMKNKVTVNFADNSLTHSQEGQGMISLPAGSGEKWAILLPQDAVEAGETSSAYSADGVYKGTRAAVPAIVDNGYLTAGIAVTVTTEVNPGEVPTGAICGKFTINSNGDQVYFSQGNLQYIGSATPAYWKFAENQWDYLGEAQNGDFQTIDRDLFGWGTSGWNNGNVYFQPYDCDQLTNWSESDYLNDYYYYASDYGYGYGPTDGTSYGYDLTGAYANADWGVYNAISNGGNTPNQWRTLTLDEWDYVFSVRSTLLGIRYAKGIVNGVNGVILLPDDWNNSVYTLNSPNRNYALFTTNEITTENWANMEANGAVFLPAAGNRHGTSVIGVGDYGDYWSSSPYPYLPGRARYFYFGSGGAGMDYYYRYDGYSVRLVREN